MELPAGLPEQAVTGRWRGGFAAVICGALLLFSASAWAQSGACDLNKDGATNIVDVQLATDNYLSCSTPAFQAFVPQVIAGALTTCPVATGIHTAFLSWAASSTSGVSYNIYRATSSGGYNYNTPLNSSPISATTFTDCQVSLSQTYYYVVRAVDGSGNQSANSGETKVTIPSL